MPDESQAPTPNIRTLVQRLTVQLDGIRRDLGRSPTPYRQTALRVYEVRQAIKKYFGEGSPTLSAFPAAPEDEASAMQYFPVVVRRLQRLIRIIEPSQNDMDTGLRGTKIFIGHGRSAAWRELKDFLIERLHLEIDEFNREATAGMTTVERWSEMLDNARFAFLVMTAEDEHTDASLHARENVVHEIGLFQGRLGVRRAIILLEGGCAEFSNVIGLSQIRFPRGNISACFEEIRRVLEREGISL